MHSRVIVFCGILRDGESEADSGLLSRDLSLCFLPGIVGRSSSVISTLTFRNLRGFVVFHYTYISLQ
jgi:hypothetical protein